MKKGTRQNN